MSQLLIVSDPEGINCGTIFGMNTVMSCCHYHHGNVVINAVSAKEVYRTFPRDPLG